MNILKSQFKLLSSLEKVFFEYPQACEDCISGSMLKNEIYSFQLAGFVEDESEWRLDLRVSIESDLKDYIKMYRIGYVPSQLLSLPYKCRDNDYLTDKPGLFPDVMNEIKDGSVNVYSGEILNIWFAVEPKSKLCGRHNIVISIYDSNDNKISELTHTLIIIDAELPKQTLINTGWFHGDCIAELHNTKIGTKEYYDVLEKYLDVYSKFGHNMILTPIFTPPLDTQIGKERLTNQLIGVECKNDEYRFDFGELDKWIDMCKKYGIEYFEMSHLFTQWGANCTPKIMATVNGEYKRIFGWDTAALSQEYILFLGGFLPQLVRFLQDKGVYENCFFHISDEPTEKCAEQYEKVRDIVRQYIAEDKMLEALSDYSFYERGLVKNPIPSNDHIKQFLEHGVDNLWTYYCCCQGDKVSNRFMAMPSYRNRILGYQLYKYKICGFLQWGFNFWFTQLSKKVINPYYVTDAYKAFPSGDAFMVYPLNEEGEVVTSLRLYVFGEALQDMRALQLLESLAGREAVEAMIEDIIGFDEYPRNAEYILRLRERVNDKIAHALE